jgi:diguanylate cyclase (GGDEF)-like protein/PAS domain S-box-containing protein
MEASGEETGLRNKALLWHPGQEHVIQFIRMGLILTALTAAILGIYRFAIMPAVGWLNMVIVVGSILLYVWIDRRPEKADMVANAMLAASLFAASLVYLYLVDNRIRVGLFFPLLISAFYLKGFRDSGYWLCAIIFILLAGKLQPWLELGYTNFELFAICLYLVLTFAIIWSFELTRQSYAKRASEAELQRQLDQHWRMALESAGDAIWDWNLQSGEFDYSKSFAEMLGYTEEELGHTSDVVPTLMHPSDRVRATQYLEAYLTGNFSGQYVSEHRFECKDGRCKWILCRGRVTARDEHGRPARMFGTHVDITERKRIETELHESEKRLRMAFEASNMGAWSYEFKNDKLYWSPDIFRFLGMAPFEPTTEFLLQSIHPDDRARVVAARERAINERYPYVVEYRVQKDHEMRWLESRAEVQYDADGRPLNMIGTIQDITERKEQEKQLQHIAHYDALTGVPNRVLLADRLLQALARAKREHGLMAVCYLDLDGFKPVNDNFGHEAGDRVLVEITRRIKETIREDDTVARLGGDEFAVLLVGMQVPEECAGSLNRLLEVIHLPIEIQGQSVRISASIGVALYPEDDHDSDTLLRHADQAMYVAKQSGKNRYHLFDAANDQRARSHHELLQQIRHGLAHGEFELYYQPKVELITRRMVGAEALLRWNHPTRGLLLPGDFMRVIEDTEIEIELGDWVIATAIDQQRRWREQGIQIELSINVSAYHLQSQGFPERLKTHSDLCCPGNCAGTLQVEVLETAALDDVTGVSAIIAECKAFGMAFALDDFGTGYSSMSYLSKFDVDVLKIDQSFIRDMLEDKGDHAIVLGIIALAKAFEMAIVAEGVETEAQYQALLQMGCAVGQGYGIARPMTADALIEWGKTA